MQSGRGLVAGIPVNTYQAARQVYGEPNAHLRIGDQIEEILANVQLRLLDPSSITDDESVYHLALITAFQFAESLPDESASDATRKRLDWKYALHLPVLYQGLPPVKLQAFRSNLFSSERAMQEYGRFLEILRGLGLFRMKTDVDFSAQRVVRIVCRISRLYRLYLSMKAALSMIGTTDPDWLRENMSARWFSQYKTGQPIIQSDTDEHSLINNAQRIGNDISALLRLLREERKVDLLVKPEILTITCVLEEQFVISGDHLIWKVPG